MLFFWDNFVGVGVGKSRLFPWDFVIFCEFLMSLFTREQTCRKTEREKSTSENQNTFSWPPFRVSVGFDSIWFSRFNPRFTIFLHVCNKKSRSKNIFRFCEMAKKLVFLISKTLFFKISRQFRL